MGFEYAGAVYHVMAVGGVGNDIFTVLNVPLLLLHRLDTRAQPRLRQ